MLARTPQFACVECGKTDVMAGFQWHGGEPHHGPAYWSDKGALCSAACAVKHATARGVAGDLPMTPAPAPFKE